MRPRQLRRVRVPDERRKSFGLAFLIDERENPLFQLCGFRSRNINCNGVTATAGATATVRAVAGSTSAKRCACGAAALRALAGVAGFVGLGVSATAAADGLTATVDLVCASNSCAPAGELFSQKQAESITKKRRKRLTAKRFVVGRIFIWLTSATGLSHLATLETGLIFVFPGAISTVLSILCGEKILNAERAETDAEERRERRTL